MRLIRGRRSVRSYRDDPVPEEAIALVLEAARWAPSAVNSQPWHFVVVRSAGRRRALAEQARLFGVLRWKHLAAAPVVVAVVGDRRGNRWCPVDCGLAGQNLMLAAHALGLGTCWVGGFEQAQVRGILGVPPGLEVIGLVTLGYPAREPKAPPRLPLEKLVSWEVYDRGAAAGRLERLRQSGIWSLVRKVFGPRPEPREPVDVPRQRDD